MRRKGIILAVIISAIVSSLLTWLLILLWIRSHKPPPDHDAFRDNNPMTSNESPSRPEGGGKRKMSAQINKISQILRKGGLSKLDLDDFGTPWRGFGRQHKPHTDNEGEAESSEGPDIFLFVVDTERADLTGPGGDTLGTTPFLSEIAAQGITFSRAYSPSSWTAPAMFSMITGLYPSEHGIISGITPSKGNSVFGQQTLPDQAVTLAERLSEAGYDTFGVCTNFHLNAKFGFAQGFNHFLGGDFENLPFPNLVTAAISAHVQESKKSFVWVHYFDPHYSYELHHPWFDTWNDSGFSNYMEMTNDILFQYYREKEGLTDNSPVNAVDIPALKAISKLMTSELSLISLGMRYVKDTETSPHARFLRAAYRSELRAVDEAMRKDFKQLKVDDQSIVIITSDHGEELFDHGWNGHRHSVYQELLHVPLVIRLPGKQHAGSVIDTPVSLIDLLPTILDLTGQKIPDGLPGRTLVPLIEGKSFEPRQLFSESMYLKNEFTSLIEYPWKLIVSHETGNTKLFNLAVDQEERNDLTEREPERTKRMSDDLFSWKKNTKLRWPGIDTKPLDQKEIQRLRALGYID